MCKITPFCWFLQEQKWQQGEKVPKLEWLTIIQWKMCGIYQFWFPMFSLLLFRNNNWSNKKKYGMNFPFMPYCRLCRTKLQIIEQIYRGFTENSRLYRAFSRQSDKVGMCNISGICPIPLWRGVYVGILFLWILYSVCVVDKNGSLFFSCYVDWNFLSLLNLLFQLN